MLHRLQCRVSECARHVAAEGSDDGFRIVAQQISGDLWVMNRLVGNAPALEEKIIFVILGSEAASSLPASTASKRNR
jgi:hypothetical protein